MMELFGFTLNATTPWLLLGLPVSTALLVYAYRYRGISAQAVVSTLLLLKRLPPHQAARKRFVPPVQFWLELAALWLLCAAAAGLSASRAGAIIAVVLDTSLSMEAPATDGTTRLETAKRLALTDMAAAPASTRFALFTANATLSARTTAPLSANAAKGQLSAVTLTPTEDQLAALLPRLLHNGEYSSVWGYTDHVLSGNTVPRALRLVSVAPPSPPTNLWIRSLASPTPDTLSVVLNATGRGTSIAVTLSAQCAILSADGQMTTHTPAPRQLQVALATPTAAQITGLDPDWSYCQVSALAAEGRAVDAITGDNQGWIVNDSSTRQVTLVGPLSPEQLKIQALRGFVIAAAVDPTRPATPNTPTIYHRTTPPATLTAPTLIVYPPEGALPWGGEVRGGSTGVADISQWSDSHPVMRYLRPTLLKLPAPRTLRCPAPATPLITATVGVVACIGEQLGIRYAVLGFELFPFDGPKTPTLSIFTLNLLQWLFSSDLPTTTLRPLEEIPLPEETRTASYLAPSPQSILRPPTRTALLGPAGVIALYGAPGTPATLRAVNLFSEQESDLTASAAIPITAVETAATHPQRREEPVDRLPYLAIAALLVFALDLLRRLRRATSWSRL
jgi:hypothetical protein